MSRHLLPADLADWRASISRWAGTLDLATPDGRADFRLRIAAETRHTRLDVLREVAIDLGAAQPGYLRYLVQRNIADAWMRSA